MDRVPEKTPEQQRREGILRQFKDASLGKRAPADWWEVISLEDVGGRRASALPPGFRWDHDAIEHQTAVADPDVLAEWLSREHALRRYLIHGLSHPRRQILKGWFTPSWIYIAYRAQFQFTGERIGTWPGRTAGKQTTEALCTSEEARWLALTMHRDPERRGYIEAVYQLGGYEHFTPDLIPRKRPGSSRGKRSAHFKR